MTLSLYSQRNNTQEKEKAAASLPPSKSHLRNFIMALDSMKDAREGTLGNTDPQLKLQYFGHLIRRVDSLEKTLMLGEIGGRRKRGRQRMRWLDGITDLMDVSLS